MVMTEACVTWKLPDLLAVTPLRKLSLLKLSLTLSSPEAVGHNQVRPVVQEERCGCFLSN